MKKLLILIPILLFSCVDSELYIDGENTGDVDVITEDPVTVYRLTSYISSFPNAEFSILIDDGYDITNIGESEIDTRNGHISKIEKGTTIFNFDYSPNGELESITNNQSQTFLISRNSNQTFSAILKDDNDQLATYIIELNDNNQITSYNMLSNDGTQVSVNLVFINGNVSTINYNVDNIPEYTWQMSYDNVANPLYKAGEKDYNAIMFLKAFENYSDQITDLNVATLLINRNNRIQEINELSSLNLVYSYENELPLNAEVKDFSNAVQGSVEYIYK